DLEREVLDLTMADRVRRTMEALPKQERRAIELAYFGGQTYREVAVTLGEPEGTIKTRIRTGLKRMRSSLQEAGVDEP
ncbi:MAG: sigma factor-like helix-turn-helix DNA-binding protein, partial [Actinomycetota bacterium]